ISCANRSSACLETDLVIVKGVGNKMHKVFPLPVIEFPLAKELPTASEESCHCQKKSKANAVKIALLSKNMAFISSAKHSSGSEDGNTACIPTASTNVPTASASVATISQDTADAYIASQSSGSQIKFEDINQIDEDDMEEIDIK
nr:hypothetical protein [Tanacetum cinerariifolium]